MIDLTRRRTLVRLVDAVRPPVAPVANWRTRYYLDGREIDAAALRGMAGRQFMLLRSVVEGPHIRELHFRSVK